MEGLVMGTRAGDCDTGLVGYLARHTELTVEQIDRLLNERSGLLGLSGRWSDMREILKARELGDQRAELAVAVFCYRVRKYIGAYLAVLGGADAVLFSGGIGERSPLCRERPRRRGHEGVLAPLHETVHEERHHRGCQQFIQAVHDAGDIYKKAYTGLYCDGCEAFKTDTEAKDNNNQCPIHKTALARRMMFGG